MLREGTCSALHIKRLILAHVCCVFFSGTELPSSKVQADTKQDYSEFSSLNGIRATGNRTNCFKSQVTYDRGG